MRDPYAYLTLSTAHAQSRRTAILSFLVGHPESIWRLGYGRYYDVTAALNYILEGILTF